MFGILFKLAKMVLNSVLQGLNQQLNIIEDQAKAPMRAMVEQVTGGIWIGQGADAFVDEVMNLVTPKVTNIMDVVSTFSGNLVKARDLIDRADEETQQLVKSRIFDAFKFY